MGRTTRHSRRQKKRAKRKAARKQSKRTGEKAGSVAIHSLLPGLEGTELGDMDVVVDTRRQEEHPALLTVSVHHRADRRAIRWSIETGFGGQPARVGYQVIADDALDEVPPTTWFPTIDGGPGVIDVIPEQADVGQEVDGQEIDADQSDTDQEAAA